jgi:hypothetical protein
MRSLLNSYLIDFAFMIIVLGLLLSRFSTGFQHCSPQLRETDAGARSAMIKELIGGFTLYLAFRTLNFEL